MKLYTFFTNAVLALALTVLPGAAQTYRPVNNGTVNGKATPATLETLVQLAGYTTTTNTSKHVFIKQQRGSHNYTVRLALSTDASKLWMETHLAKLTPDRANSPAYLRHLLEANSVGPHTFAIENGVVLMQMPMDNLALSPDYVRSKVSELLNLAENSAPKWEAVQ